MRAARTSRRGVPATPAAVLTTIGKKAPSAIRKKADPSRMPKKITANGTQAVIGMGRSIWMIGASAALAGEGLTGPAPIFEGDLGFFKLVAREAFAPAPFGGEAGNTDGFMINKTYIKFWPAEYHSQSAIDAALQLRAELMADVSQVASIDIATFEASYNIIGKYPEAWAPKTRETADH